jgi:hypothetical protein
LTTTKQEKLDALRNAVINSAIITNFNEINQHIFLIFLEQFSEYHIKFLKLLDNQIDKIQDLNFKNLDGSFLWNPNFYHLITKLNHELEQREDFCRMIMNDLFYKNLINTKDYDFPIILNSQNQYIVGKRTTILGLEFINFISESKNIE